jgi:hypothetical protein
VGEGSRPSQVRLRGSGAGPGWRSLEQQLNSRGHTGSGCTRNCRWAGRWRGSGSGGMLSRVGRSGFGPLRDPQGPAALLPGRGPARGAIPATVVRGPDIVETLPLGAPAIDAGDGALGGEVGLRP